MGFFSEMMGNASEIDINEIREDYAKFLAPGERIEHAYRLIRDLFIFTDKRLICRRAGIDRKRRNTSRFPIRVLLTLVSRQPATSI